LEGETRSRHYAAELATTAGDPIVDAWGKSSRPVSRRSSRLEIIQRFLSENRAASATLLKFDDVITGKFQNSEIQTPLLLDISPDRTTLRLSKNLGNRKRALKRIRKSRFAIISLLPCFQVREQVSIFRAKNLKSQTNKIKHPCLVKEFPLIPQRMFPLAGLSRGRQKIGAPRMRGKLSRLSVLKRMHKQPKGVL